MADPIKARYVSQFKLEPVASHDKPNLPEAAGTAVRSAGSVALPTLIRLGVLPATMIASKVPGWGNVIAGGIGGVAEGAAQMAEKHTIDPRKLNYGRMGIEALLSGIGLPAAKTVKGAAAIGGAAAAAGVAGRKYTSENKDEQADWYNPTKWSLWDDAQIVGGSLLGGALGKLGAGKIKAPNTIPHGPETIEDFLRSHRKWNPEQIKTEVAKMEANGYPESAQGLRVAALKTNTGDRDIYETISKVKATNAAQEAKNTAAGAVAGGLPTIQEALARGPKAVEELALRAEALGNHDYAKNLRAEAVKLGANSATTSRAVIRGTKAEQTTAEKASLEAKKAAEVARRKGLLGDDLEEHVSYRDSVSAATPEGGRESASITLKPKPEEGAAPRKPKGSTPNIPPTDKFQIVNEAGQIMELEDENSVRQLIEAAGPDNGLTVIPPKGAPAAPTASTAPKIPATPEGPKAPSVPAPFNAPRIIESTPLQKELAEKTVEEAAKLRGTPEDIPANAAAQQLEAERRAIEEAEKLKVKGHPAADIEPEAQAGFEPRVGTIPVSAPSEGNPETAKNLWEDLLLRLRVGAKNPKSGAPEANIGTYDPKRGGLILQPKEGGGYIRDEFSPEGIKHSETRTPQNTGSKFDNPPYTRDELAQIKADLPNIQDPLVREMAERELGRKVFATPKEMPKASTPAPAAPPSTPKVSRVEAPIEGPSAPAPQAILDKVNEFVERRTRLLNAAISQEEAEAIAKQLEPESNALQLELSQAESVADKASRGGKGGSSVGFLGMSPDVLDAIKRNPKLAMQLMGGAGGALYGASASEDDPLSGALLGGAAGALGGTALGHLNPSVLSAGINPMDRAVNFERFSLLSNPKNLAINTAAPTGGAIMSSIERMLLGDESGLNGLKSTLNVRERLASIPEDWRIAKDRIARAGETRADMSGGTPTFYDRVIAAPADMMTAGDESTRAALKRGGWTEAAAREATLTNEPRYAFTKALANLPRTGGPLARLSAPFVKTAANAIEGSAERTPLLGFYMNRAAGNPEATATYRELVTRQGIGAAVSYGSYKLGQEMDPETAKTMKMSVILSNMGGQYGPLAAAAFAAGQAAGRGKSGLDQIGAGAQHFMRDVPLPTTENPLELVKSLAAYATGSPPKPNANTFIERWVPDKFIPRLIKNPEMLEGIDEVIKPRYKSRF